MTTDWLSFTDHVKQALMGSPKARITATSLQLRFLARLSSMEPCVEILRAYSLASLRSVRLDCATSWWHIESAKIATILSSLLPLSQLEHVHIHLDKQTLELTTDQLLQMGAAWPRLHHLHIELAASEKYSNVDIRALGDLGHLCPSLARLVLPALFVSNSPDRLSISASPNYTVALLHFDTIFAPASVSCASIMAALRDAFPLSSYTLLRRTYRPVPQ